MNPYDFVRINWEHAPERHRPVWHHRFVGNEDQALYAGHIEVEVHTETPLFIFDPRDGRSIKRSMQNKQGDYIIPGSSLKGLLRSLVETLGNGCLSLFDGNYEWDKAFRDYKAAYEQKVKPAFRRCPTNANLCIACRMFGMLKDGTPYAFLGNVTISDACTVAKDVPLHAPMYTQALMGPQPHHRAFYLDESQNFIAGRKYYFHHSSDKPPLAESGFKTFGNNSTPMNKHIQPIDRGAIFRFRLDFTNLAKDEFALLLLALTLEEGMRHKLGYGKPMGLGSVHLVPTALTLVDYTTRYTQMGMRAKKAPLQGADLQKLRDELVGNFSRAGLDQQAMNDLRRIWLWPVDPTIEYCYPSKKNWFDTPASRGKRIADTLDVAGDIPRSSAR